MHVIATALPDVLIVEPKVFGDERGFFQETWNERAFAGLGLDIHFVQDNQSRSSRGVLRGLHFQRRQPQGKLVRVAKGRVFDVAVDMRRSSSHFGQWVGVELSERNHRMLWIPAGFAHGFLTLEDETDFIYKCSDFYSPGDEVTVRWDDPAIGIEWPIEGMTPIVSEKDRAGVALAQADVFE